MGPGSAMSRESVKWCAASGRVCRYVGAWSARAADAAVGRRSGGTQAGARQAERGLGAHQETPGEHVKKHSTTPPPRRPTASRALRQGRAAGGMTGSRASGSVRSTADRDAADGRRRVNETHRASAPRACLDCGGSVDMTRATSPVSRKSSSDPVPSCAASTLRTSTAKSAGRRRARVFRPGRHPGTTGYAI